MAQSPKPRKGAPAFRGKPNTTVAKAQKPFVDDEDEDIENAAEDSEDPDDDAEAILQQHVKKLLAEERKNSSARSKVFQTNKAKLYGCARQNAKEIVQASDILIDEMKAKIAELKQAEVPFSKLYEDRSLPAHREKEALDKVQSHLRKLLEDLGPLIADEVNETSDMITSIPDQLEEAFLNISKTARVNLEDAKKQEKVAEDADMLIKHVKGLLLQ